MNDKKLKVAIYCRVATENNCIDSQIIRLKSYCNSNGYDIYKIYADIGSNVDEERKNYKLLLKDLTKNKYDVILAKSLFTINASSIKLKEITKLVDEYNCNLIALDENYNYKRDYEKYMREREKYIND